MIIKGGKTKNVTRVQFELPNDKVRQLEGLTEETNIRTKKELINNALTLLEWAVKEKRLGHEIASIDEKENVYKELIMPALSNVTEKLKTSHSIKA